MKWVSWSKNWPTNQHKHDQQTMRSTVEELTDVLSGFCGWGCEGRKMIVVWSSDTFIHLLEEFCFFVLDRMKGDASCLLIGCPYTSKAKTWIYKVMWGTQVFQLDTESLFLFMDLNQWRSMSVWFLCQRIKEICHLWYWL